jgi:hypothetical protein
MRVCAQAAQAQHDSSFSELKQTAHCVRMSGKVLHPSPLPGTGRVRAGGVAAWHSCAAAAASQRGCVSVPEPVWNLSGTRLDASPVLPWQQACGEGWDGKRVVHCRHCRGRPGRRRAICEGTGASQLPGRVWAFGMAGRRMYVDMVSTNCKFCPEVRKMKGSTVRSGQQLMGAISTSGHHGTIGAHARLSA